jgi:maleate isomerase
MNAMAPDGVAIHGARVPFGAMRAGGEMDATIPNDAVRAFAGPPHLDDAAELLSEAPLHAIAYGFTSSAYLLGLRAEEEMVARLRERTHGIPVVATCSAALQALQVLDVQRIALIDPPWFDEELNAAGRTYYESAGFEVAFAAPCELPSGQALIDPQSLHDWVAGHTPDSAQAVVIGGNGLRAVGVIAALEATLGRPVLTANQVLFWAALRAARSDTSQVKQYGRIFST